MLKPESRPYGQPPRKSRLERQRATGSCCLPAATRGSRCTVCCVPAVPGDGEMSGYDWTHARGYDAAFDAALADYVDRLAAQSAGTAGAALATAARQAMAKAGQPETAKPDTVAEALPVTLPQTLAAAASRPRRPSLRPRRPASLGPRLTPAALDLLRVLAQLARTGEVAPTKAELGTRIGRHMDTVRRALRCLEAENLIDTQHRHGPRPDCDRPSIYRVLPLGWAWLGWRAQATDDPATEDRATAERVTDARESDAQASDSRLTDNRTGHPVPAAAPAAARGMAPRCRPRSEIMRHPSESESDSVEGKMSAPGRGATGAPGAPASLASTETRPSASGRPDTSPPATPIHGARQEPRGGAARRSRARAGMPAGRGGEAGEGASLDALARAAVVTLSARGAFLGSRGGPQTSPWAALDYLRRTELSKFHGAAWSRAVEVHGARCCLLAAAVAMLRSRSADGRGIADDRSRASYLGGILRVETPNPAASLRFLLSDQEPRPGERSREHASQPTSRRNLNKARKNQRDLRPGG